VKLRLTALAAVAAAVALLAIVQPFGGGSGAGEEPGWFAPDSVWNRPLAANEPTAAKSTAYVAELERQLRAVGPYINTTEYSTPVYRVPAGQPTVAVRLESENGEEIDPALTKAMEAVPLPEGAKPARGTDGHLVVWQPETDEMWEFWQLRREGGGWVAAYGGAMREVSTNPGYYDARAWPGAQDYWGATATSLPLLGGLMTIAELRARRIEHALALAIPEPSPEFVFPAQRSDGYDHASGAIPEGTRFRLPADLDLDKLKLSPLVAAIARAAQRYGMIVRDVSGTVSLYGEAPKVGDPDPYGRIFGGEYPNRLLEEFPWERLVAVEPPEAAS
jgi:hypothetical protein